MLWKMARSRAIFCLSGFLVCEGVKEAYNQGGQQLSEGIRLIVGLGNPGSEYQNTRHNAGFWFVDRLADEYREPFRLEKKFFGEICKVSITGQPCWLLKPMTYMNKSGQSLAAIASYYKIEPQNILVAHDELDHDAGSTRLKLGGGHAGHNGLRDIISAIGTKDFYRLRLGIGHPGNKKQVVSLSIMDMVVAGEMEKAMHRLHSS